MESRGKLPKAFALFFGTRQSMGESGANRRGLSTSATQAGRKRDCYGVLSTEYTVEYWAWMQGARVEGGHWRVEIGCGVPDLGEAWSGGVCGGFWNLRQVSNQQSGRATVPMLDAALPDGV